MKIASTPAIIFTVKILLLDHKLAVKTGLAGSRKKIKK
jgi:hypothetical protein